MLKTDERDDYKDCTTYNEVLRENCGDFSMCGWCPLNPKKSQTILKDEYKDCQFYKGTITKCAGVLDDPVCTFCPKYNKQDFLKETTYTDNPERKVYNIDFDGTLTTGEYAEWPWSNLEMILKVKKLYLEGNIIIIWSARLWEYAPNLASWLIHYGVPFHGIILGKGGADYYIDDKAINSNDFLSKK